MSKKEGKDVLTGFGHWVALSIDFGKLWENGDVLFFRFNVLLLFF